MKNITRHTFLKILNRFFAFSGIAFITTPILAYFYPPKLEETPSEPVLVCPENELNENESKTVQFGRYPALVIHTSQGLKAYSAVCTHFACIVKWDPDLGEIVCPCHDGFFDPLDGSVISGPPPTPLETLAINIIDGQIYIGGEA
jgi:cytochrome b6-f complex iron-sulfur subunit